MFNIFVKDMGLRDTGAEKKIKETAKRIFFAEGKLHATTQDIADAAGVTRTLVNYYFRSVDLLMQQVFKEAMNDLSIRFDKVMESDLPFRKKIENLIEVFLIESIAFPYQETFLVTELINDKFSFPDENKPPKVKHFLSQIEDEMKAGLITSTNPFHFLLNLFSLMAYPIIMGPLYKKLFSLNDHEYMKLIAERKEIICELIFR
jgi:TetR/AcrR family transcriptional regulator